MTGHEGAVLLCRAAATCLVCKQRWRARLSCHPCICMLHVLVSMSHRLSSPGRTLACTLGTQCAVCQLASCRTAVWLQVSAQHGGSSYVCLPGTVAVLSTVAAQRHTWHGGCAYLPVFSALSFERHVPGCCHAAVCSPPELIASCVCALSAAAPGGLLLEGLPGVCRHVSSYVFVVCEHAHRGTCCPGTACGDSSLLVAHSSKHLSTWGWCWEGGWLSHAGTGMQLWAGTGRQGKEGQGVRLAPTASPLLSGTPLQAAVRVGYTCLSVLLTFL
jgi:hypothetical protein